MVIRIFLKKMIKVSLLVGLILLNVSCARILQNTNTPDLKSGEYSKEMDDGWQEVYFCCNFIVFDCLPIKCTFKE